MAPNQHEQETAPLLDENNNTQRVKPAPLTASLIRSNPACYGSTSQWHKLLRYDPVEHRKLENPTSNLDTLLHMLNGNLGTGILAMPDAFRNAGLYVGLFGTMFMGVICTNTMHMLVKCSHELCRRYQVPSLSFSEVGQYALESGPSCLQPFGRLFGAMINFCLLLLQLGCCCVYFLFVAVNLRDFLEYASIKVDVFTILLYLLIPTIAMNMIKSLKYLTPISFIATALSIAGIVIAFMFLFNDLPHSSTVPSVSDWSTLPLYFGTAIYAIEGIAVILPLENNMKTPKDFCKWNGVLNLGMTIVVCLYSAVGYYGYIKYGEEAQGSITLNLPNEDFLAQMVRLMTAAAVFASYALQFYVPMTIIGPVVRGWFDSRNAQDCAEYTLRVALILFTFTLAAIIPNLGAFISLVGAVGTSTLALVYPALIDIVTYWPERKYGTWNWVLWKDIAIAGCGIFGFLVGTKSSIALILAEYE